jgi:hypothetical protein
MINLKTHNLGLADRLGFEGLRSTTLMGASFGFIQRLDRPIHT